MPDWNEEIRTQLADLNLPPAREAEIVEELAQHAEDRFRELRNGGAVEAEARRIALDEIGDHELLARELRAVERPAVPPPVVLGAGSRGRGDFISSLGQDLRYGFRTLRKNPGFTAVAMLALALGIGANTAIFSVVNGVLLRPLAYPDPGRLLMIFESNAEFSQSSVAYPDFLDWRRESRSFTDMGAFRSDNLNFTGAGEPEHLSGEYVSASLFPVLGITPLLGRNFLPKEDRQGAACAAGVFGDAASKALSAARICAARRPSSERCRCLNVCKSWLSSGGSNFSVSGGNVEASNFMACARANMEPLASRTRSVTS